MPLAAPRPAERPSAAPRCLPSWQHWPVTRVSVLSAVASALLTVWFFAPRFWLWPVAGMPLSEFVAIQPEFHRAFHALNQLQHPWQRIDDVVNRVIEWRLLWPVVAHYLGLPKGLYFALPHLGCVLALTGVAAIAWRTTKHALPTITATLLAASASWFFVSTGWLAYFDSWLILALLFASFAQARWILFAVALFAPWIDERFILALPLCLAVRTMGANRDAAPDSRGLLRDAAALLGGVLPYIAIRLGAEAAGLRATSGSYWSNRPVLPASPLVMAWGAWNGLRLGWVVLAVDGLAAFRTGVHRLAVLIVVATIALALCVADDLSRSASLALPALLAAVLLAWRDRTLQAQRLLPLLCVGNLALPAWHVIAAPGTSVAYHNVAILGLDAELERARNPPEFANAATYTRRSMDHFQNQNLPRALIAAEIALRFDPKSAKALANHGVILFVQGEQARGAAELDRALVLAPELYDARMQRAAFRQQAGDLRGALDDVRRALQDMPADWPRRAEAQQFERALAAQTAR